MLIKRLALLALLLCVTGTNGAVRAREISERSAEDAMSARVDQLEAEIAALRRQSAGALAGEPGCGCAAVSGCAMDCGCGEGGGCCENDCCGGCWCAPGCSCGFYGGAEVFWAQPRWRAFDAITVSTLRVLPAISTSSATAGFDYDYDPTARFFVGYTGCNGLGVRASWWQLDQDANPVSFTIPGAVPAGVNNIFVAGPLGVAIEAGGVGGIGSRFTSDQSLELQTWDFEATSCFQACGGNIIAGFGLRYAKVDVTTREASFQPTGAPIEAVDLRESFEGWGPTVSMEFVRPLCFSGFSLYSNLRGSVLIGDEQQTARRFSAAGALTDIAARDAAEGLGVAELQIALQWCHGGWFARAGWQAQYWEDLARDNAPPAGAGFFAPPGGGFPDGDSNTRSDLIVQGFFFALGAQY